MKFKNSNIQEKALFLAHEVKNPISLIKANIELLELDSNMSIYEKNIDIIKKELNKITFIISDFLDTNKKDFSSFKTIKNFDLILLLKELNQNLSLINKTKKINFCLKCFCESNQVFIDADYLKLSILFSNIYKNAIEAIDFSGNINTYIKKEQGFLIVEIKDDGKGLDLSLKNNIGKLFFTTKKTGSGIGLSICKQIVDELGATFEIFNNKDKGCTVRIKFIDILDT